jgi:hypothetical protein
MFKKSLVLIFFCIVASCTTAPPLSEPIIVPSDCVLSFGQEFPLSLRGSFPSDAIISWEATGGTIMPQEGLTVVYKAPDKEGTIIITATVDANGTKTTPAPLICTIKNILVYQTPTYAVTFTPETPTQETRSTTIAVTEVMADPCGSEQVNEFIELYNYGTESVDVGNWWFVGTGKGQGTPDKIVSWNAGAHGYDMGDNVITNTTNIPPGGFAVILSPLYPSGQGQYAMPYFFPKKTILLTIYNSQRLGNDSFGLLGTDEPLDVVVLYIGTHGRIDQVVSTYGSPTYGSSPETVRDNGLDGIPLVAGECHSVERTTPTAPDEEEYWQNILNGTPGR